ncbi:hypothetical protein FHL15_002579 [Xylaria flabelliformis]|uniref:Zn(2)-C6 fungal-type domain-containing protein n=1 Tax=Xylaria flabelliformis TaxID=2512241 RepID=A0A553I7Y2_9PEZI|nr:hypothetical protein FHL15_002579 [Xylaria flabelliformis]
MQPVKPIRKACDLCYRRRIKCDGQKPRCSHCVIYDADCTRKATARKPNQRRGLDNTREAALEARVKSLESQLATALEKLKGLETACPFQETHDITNSDSQGTGDGSMSAHSPGHNAMLLDPLNDILPVVEWYLTTSNSFLPLFDPSALLTAVKDWYYKPHTRQPAVWAMINVVLALAHHNGYSGRNSRSINDTTYIKNAQSVLSDAIAQKTNLTHVQVLIGLSMLFRTANEPTPAVVLIATAIRLAQKLGLHRKSLDRHDSALRLQKERVFWIAYILDRSISAQTAISPVQRDIDIELDLPPLEPVNDDLAGFVVLSDGHTKFNFLRASIQMARIQGLVHESIYSAPGQNRSSTQKAHNIRLIHQELDAWTAQVPLEFHPTTLQLSERPEVLRHFCMVYSARLSRRAFISYGTAADIYHYSHWIQRLQNYGESLAAGQVISRTQDHQGWLTLVNESRDFLKLFLTVQSRDAIFTIDMSFLDDNLIEAALPHLGDIVKQTGSLEEIYNALHQLRSYTHVISPRPHWHVRDFQNDQAWARGAKPLDSDIVQYLFTFPEEGLPWNLENMRR